MELKIDEGRVYGAKYLTVEPNHWPLFTPWDQIEAWCTETYGPQPVDGVFSPNARWYLNNSKVWFRSEKDLEWFILRWQ